MLEQEQVGTIMVRKVLSKCCCSPAELRLIFCLSAAAGCHSALKSVSLGTLGSVCAWECRYSS